MKYGEILREVATAHNLLSNIYVNSNNAIYMGDALRILRSLAERLREESEAEESEAQDDAEICERPET